MGCPMTICSVYWIHHPDHTDMFSQGYIGVSKNITQRFYEHKNNPSNAHLKHAIKKYGWKTLVKKVLLIAEETYCLMIETKLRAKNKIGWNLVIGGGKPPSALGKKFGPMSELTKAKMSASKIGKRHTPEIETLVTQNLIVHGVKTRFQKGQKAHNKGIPMSEQQKQHYKIELTCPHCQKVGKKIGMRRWHMDKCKYKEAL
jgi:predicted GIY-YIG superfamily endonuclease